MDNKNNKYIAVSYELNSIEGDKITFVEKATAEEPFQFLSGFGITLELFEKNLVDLNEGDSFDFILNKEDAYGDYVQERVIDLDRSIFTINGHFDEDNIFVGALVPLQNADGNKFYGRVLDINDDKVKMDLNSSLAGKSLHFTGKVIQSRPATDKEIESYINQMSGDGECSGHCHDCEGCGHHHEE